MLEKDIEKEALALKAELKWLKKTHLGLVFEDKVEEVVSQCQENIPVLNEVRERKITSANSKFNNILIEGDNYHSLSILNYTHKEKIDIIYIDPPYNTGKKDFIYNDKFIDKEDGYRHSKWLSFMQKRLELARNLLKESGVIFISIDDNEQAHLKILCDRIFGEDNFIANIPRRTKSAGKTTDAIALNHDYVLVYVKDRRISSFNALAIDDSAYKFKDEYYEERGPYALSQTLDYDSLSYSPSLDYELLLDGETYYPGTDKNAFLSRKQGVHRSSDWTWRWSKELFDFGNKNAFIVVKKTKNGHSRIYTKTYYNVVIKKIDKKYKIIKVDRTKNLATLDLMESSFSNDVAKKDLRAIFGPSAEFSYPKPVSLVKYLINTVEGNEDATVLDFFAGSGTTAQAVLELNQEQGGGNREFILCTNNENNIAENITYKRIKSIIEGYANTKAIPDNFSYYKTDLVDVEHLNKVSDDAKIRITYQSGEMIAVREGTLSEIDKNDWWQIFEGHEKITAIYFKEDKTKLRELVENLEKMNIQTALYIFSWGKNEYRGEYSSANIRIEDIPDPILEVYKEINSL